MAMSAKKESVTVYYKTALRKIKPLAAFKTEWEITRKYGVLTKKKYENFYLRNPDVHEVLVHETLKQRSLGYYTEFVEKIMRQYVLKVFKNKS
jgi:hypothetical protein